jgi:hypothetical protein
MCGISNMVHQLVQLQNTQPVTSIDREQFKIWHHSYLFHALMNQRYGQDFCNHFNITDNLLFYENDPERAKAYIEKNYLK